MKEKFIEVYDDIIPVELQDYLISITLNKSPNLSSQDDAFLLFFNEGATTPEGKVDNYDFIFANILYNNDKENKLNKFSFSFFQVLYKLCDYLKINLHEVFRMTYYHQPPSIEPKELQPHIDQFFPHWVCLYYLDDSDGDTYFYDNNGTVINQVSPKKGRIVFFDGSIYHSASRPSSTHRKALNINFIGNFYE